MWEWLSNLGGGLKDFASGLFSSGAEQLAGPGAGAATSAGSGFGSGLMDIASGIGKGVLSGGSVLGDIAKMALPVAQVGTAGLGAYSGFKAAQQAAEQNKLLRRSQQMQEEAIAPLSTYGQEQLRLASGGEIPAAERAKIDEWKAAALQQIRDYLARSGQGDSTALRSWEDKINQQAVAMESSVLDSMRRGGVTALTSAAGGAANMQQGAANERGSIEALIAQANQALAQMAGGQR